MQNKTTEMSIHLLISTAEQLLGGSPHLLDKSYLLKYMFFPPLEWSTSLWFSNNSHALGRQQPPLEDMKYIVCGLRLQNRWGEGIKSRASCAKLISGCFNPPPHALVGAKDAVSRHSFELPRFCQRANISPLAEWGSWQGDRLDGQTRHFNPHTLSLHRFQHFATYLLT